MGTACAISLFANSKIEADSIAAMAIAEIERIEKKYSRYLPDSELSRINQTEPGTTLEVDEETQALLDYAFACYRISDGLFDITSGIFRRVWNFSSDTLPEPDAIAELLQFVGMDKIVWVPPRISFRIPNLELDFGGIGKEYAVDRTATIVQEAGITSALINLGGDMRAVGPCPGDVPWRITLQDPNNASASLNEIGLFRGAIATSGNYERCIVDTGHRYGHILNPKTGWPVPGLASVSVLASQCMVAGSAATIAVLKGPHGKDWLLNRPLKYFWVDDNGRQGGSWPPVWSSELE